MRRGFALAELCIRRELGGCVDGFVEVRIYILCNRRPRRLHNLSLVPLQSVKRRLHVRIYKYNEGGQELLDYLYIALGRT